MGAQDAEARVSQPTVNEQSKLTATETTYQFSRSRKPDFENWRQTRLTRKYEKQGYWKSPYMNAND